MSWEDLHADIRLLYAICCMLLLMLHVTDMGMYSECWVYEYCVHYIPTALSPPRCPCRLICVA